MSFKKLFRKCLKLAHWLCFVFISVLEFLNAGRELHWIITTSTLIIITYITLHSREIIWRFLKFYIAASLSGIQSLNKFQLKGKFVFTFYLLSKKNTSLWDKNYHRNVLSMNEFRLMKECFFIQYILSKVYKKNHAKDKLRAIFRWQNMKRILFDSLTILYYSILIPLPAEFLEYLHTDGVVLPEG